MTYEQFLDIVFGPINKIISLLGNILNGLMNNYIFITILYTITFIFLIDNIDEIIKIIKNIFTRKKESSKNKEKNKTNIE